jgi:hypothetical protein
MCILNRLRPRKLEEQGDKLVSEARRLLDRRGAEISQTKLDQVEDKLVW